MTSFFKLSFNRRVVVRVAITALLGAILSLAIGQLSSANTVRASNHCTHYSDPYGGDTSGWCGEVYDVYVNGYITTGGTTPRDDNIIATSNYEQYDCVQYKDPNTGDPYDNACEGGGNSAEYGASDGGAFARCLVYTTDLGVCKTDWHN